MYKFIGLAFNKNRKLTNEYSEDIDGCFRIIDNNIVITSSDGYIPTYYSIDKKEIVEINSGFNFNIDRYISLPENSYFNLKTMVNKIYTYPNIIKENIFEYFEKWFCDIYKELLNNYKLDEICLTLTCGLDSRYLLSILRYNNLPYNCYTSHKEGQKVLSLFKPIINNIKFIENTSLKNNDNKKYFKEYNNIYKNISYKNYHNGLYIYIYYKKLINNNIKIIIDGMGRNHLTNNYRFIDSSDRIETKKDFMCGRCLPIINNEIKIFFPYSCKDIRYNLKRLNYNEIEMTKAIYNRIKFLDTELYQIETSSFNKAEDINDIINKEKIKIFKIPFSL